MGLVAWRLRVPKIPFPRVPCALLRCSVLPLQDAEAGGQGGALNEGRAGAASRSRAATTQRHPAGTAATARCASSQPRQFPIA